jgi:hypothetical protein
LARKAGGPGGKGFWRHAASLMPRSKFSSANISDAPSGKAHTELLEHFQFLQSSSVHIKLETFLSRHNSAPISQLRKIPLKILLQAIVTTW